MKRRDKPSKPLDVHRKLQLVRSWEELIIEHGPGNDINDQITLQQQFIQAATSANTAVSLYLLTKYISPKIIYLNYLKPGVGGVKKKRLNIPICDVENDSEYPANVSATYQIPQSYVKYTKKIGGTCSLPILA